ncbi:MAG TPA: T9SS type A sorting domain-containing protein, partial [Bacteroidales bacterium]|nr:T9SS type A sorting domain-containing protein [Bacteroidales bacterium]
FSSKYKKAANVDNNLLINAIDISRLKAKIGAPYNITKNFPRGNWVSLDKLVSISGSDVVLNLETICYGDYNASSVKYRDSLVNWNAGKSIEKNIILFADDYVTTTDPAYFELPLRISSTVKDFSALGLELHYAVNDFKLVSASMSHTGKNQVVKINPTLEEIIADDNDLLVTGEDGVIRVVYATTRHFDVAAGDEVIRLGFRPMKDMSQGILDFELSGTGIFGDQYGEEQEDTYLIIPKILVQGNSAETGFDLSGYPNPFNGHAILNYCLPEDGNVKISVYNTLGERVCVLINESQAVGKHTAEFICGELAQGMYTFKLDFTGVNKSKCLIIKMIH